MSLSSQIRSKLESIPEGQPFGYGDLAIKKEEFMAAAKSLGRLVKAGKIKKVSKGVFYKPEQTVFGELQPSYDKLLNTYLFENGKRIAYVTGVSLYNRYSLTTQMAFKIKIASRSKRITINRGALIAKPVKSYVEVTDENYESLGLLDAFKDIKKIPDSSVSFLVIRLRSILSELTETQKDELISYARYYPARVKALVGAILDDIGYFNMRLIDLKAELNPFTTVKLGINDEVLPTRKKWNIE